jgi:hypothetical protein
VSQEERRKVPFVNAEFSADAEGRNEAAEPFHPGVIPGVFPSAFTPILPVMPQEPKSVQRTWAKAARWRDSLSHPMSLSFEGAKSRCR